jgi:hypothetical protein
MSKSSVTTGLLGAAFMAWGGAGITAALGLVGWAQVNVSIFAVGIILLAQAPYFSLLSRIRQLERELKVQVADSPSAR